MNDNANKEKSIKDKSWELIQERHRWKYSENRINQCPALNSCNKCHGTGYIRMFNDPNNNNKQYSYICKCTQKIINSL